MPVTLRTPIFPIYQKYRHKSATLSVVSSEGAPTCARMAEMHYLDWMETIYREHRQPLFLTAWKA